MILDSTLPPTGLRPISSLITDPNHLDMPTADGQPPRWLNEAVRHIQAGYVHTVFAEPFTACFWRVGAHVLLRATSRHTDFALTLEAPVPPSAASLQFLYRHAKAIFNDICPFPPAGAAAQAGA